METLCQDANEALAYELRVMQDPKFVIHKSDLFLMATRLSGWVDAQEEYRDEFTDPSHEDRWNFMPSGRCWQLLPREWKIVRKATAYECKGCSAVETGEYLALEGTNHLGVDYLVHVGWLIAQAMQQAGLISNDDYKVTFVGACDECCMREFCKR